MTKALEECAPRFDEQENADVRLSFAGSDELAAQIQQRAPVDVYAAANTKLPDQLHTTAPRAAGRVRHQRVRARRAEGLATSARSTISRSRAPRSRSAPSPCRSAPTRARRSPKLPPDEEKAILANVRSNEPDVKGIVGKLTQGAADAGFVYVTDVNAAAGDLKAIKLPPDLEPQVTYGAGVRQDRSSRSSRKDSSMGSRRAHARMR